MIKPSRGSVDNAGILGIHVEGPFIQVKKKGAHPEKYIQPASDFARVIKTFGGESGLRNIRIFTLAPECVSNDVISELSDRGIMVSLGHSASTLGRGEEAINVGASMITHLFNAMSAFHHRADPGLIGLLTSTKVNKKVYYGLIADGEHSHPAALRLAYMTNFEGLCLVSDAIGAMGVKKWKV